MAGIETPRIEVTHIERATEDEKVVADLKAALYLKGDGDPDGGIRVPDITFQAKSAVTTATGISSKEGFFEQKDLMLDKCPAKRGADITEISIMATYNEGDEVKTVTEQVRVDISKQLDTVYGKKKDRKNAEEKRKKEEKDKEARRLGEEERKRLKKEADEALAPERKRQIKADITKAGEDIKSTQRFQKDPFNVLREHADHPHAERTAIMVAAEAAERTVEAIEIYKSAGWAEKVMKIATERQPLMAIEIVEKYKDRDWAPEILKVTAQRYPHEVVRALSRYCEYEWGKEIVMHIAENEPQAAFEEVEMWEFYPWAEEAAIVAANKAPEFTVNNFPLYQDQPWAQRVYESVAVSGNFTSSEKAEAQRLLKKKITEAGAKLLTEKPANPENFAILYEHRFHPHSKVVMINVAEKASDACIKAVGMYKSAEWAREIMLLATAKSPVTAINEIDEYIEMEWAADVMGKAASLKPKEVIKSLPKYAGYTWSKSIVELIANSYPAIIFEEMDFIEYQSWAEQVVGLAAIKEPQKALSLQSGYQNQPWAVAIVKGIEDRKQLAAQQVQKQKALEERKAREQKALEERKAREQKALEERQPEVRVNCQPPAQRPDSEIMRERRSIRNAILGLGVIAVLVGGTYLGYEGYEAHKAHKANKCSQKILGQSDVNLEGIKLHSDKILPDDISSHITEEKIEGILRMLDISNIFKKNEDGSYKYRLPAGESVEDLFETFPLSRHDHFDRVKSDREIERTGMKRDVRIARIGDGVVTVELSLKPWAKTKGWSYKTGIIFKDYHYVEGVTRYETTTTISNWMIIQLDLNEIGEYDETKGRIVIKEHDHWPVAESIEFEIDSNMEVTILSHLAELKCNSTTMYRSEVVHNAKDQATIREIRKAKEVKTLLDSID